MATRYTIGSAPLTPKDVADVAALCVQVVLPEGGLPAPASAPVELPSLPALGAGGADPAAGSPLSAGQSRAILFVAANHLLTHAITVDGRVGANAPAVGAFFLTVLNGHREGAGGLPRLRAGAGAPPLGAQLALAAQGGGAWSAAPPAGAPPPGATAFELLALSAAGALCGAALALGLRAEAR